MANENREPENSLRAEEQRQRNAASIEVYRSGNCWVAVFHGNVTTHYETRPTAHTVAMPQDTPIPLPFSPHADALEVVTDIRRRFPGIEVLSRHMY